MNYTRTSTKSETEPQIVQSFLSSLGLSNEEAERMLKTSMNSYPDKEIDRAMNALKRIQHSDLITNLYQKCMRIAEISGQSEMVEIVDNIFDEIKSTK